MGKILALGEMFFVMLVTECSFYAKMRENESVNKTWSGNQCLRWGYTPYKLLFFVSSTWPFSFTINILFSFNFNFNFLMVLRETL